MRLAKSAAAAAIAVATLSSPAAAAPGDLQYATIYTHDQSGFLRAVRAGNDFVSSGRGKRFRVILAGAGVIVVIPGSSTVQRDYMRTRRGGGLEIIACKETVDALSTANRRRIPVIPGVSVQPCASLRNKMSVGGWQVAPGFQ